MCQFKLFEQFEALLGQRQIERMQLRRTGCQQRTVADELVQRPTFGFQIALRLHALALPTSEHHRPAGARLKEHPGVGHGFDHNGYRQPTVQRLEPHPRRSVRFDLCCAGRRGRALHAYGGGQGRNHVQQSRLVLCRHQQFGFADHGLEPPMRRRELRDLTAPVANHVRGVLAVRPRSVGFEAHRDTTAAVLGNR